MIRKQVVLNFFFQCLFIFLYQKILQAHIFPDLALESPISPKIHRFLYWKTIFRVPRSEYQVCLLLLGYHCLQVLSEDMHIYIKMYKQGLDQDGRGVKCGAHLLPHTYQKKTIYMQNDGHRTSTKCLQKILNLQEGQETCHITGQNKWEKKQKREREEGRK